MAENRYKTSSPLHTQIVRKPTLRIKTNLSNHHLRSAAFLARQSAKYETRKKVTEVLKTKHRAYVTGAITLAIASLEAAINELFREAVDRNKKMFNKSSLKDVLNLLAKLWEIAEERRFAILYKYQLVLTVAEKDIFNEGKPPYQDVASAIQLRNALVHYTPEWDTDQKAHKRIESRLKSKFKLNPFVGSTQSFFPYKCLSHGCAEWVIKSCIRFMDEFYKKLDYPLKWDGKIRMFLKKGSSPN